MGVLPTATRKPVIDIRTLNILVYGAPGIGKSTLASQAPSALFFATEDGVKTLEVMEYRVKSWGDIEEGYKELREQAQNPDRPWKTVVIDTVDNWIMMGADKICKENNWAHEGLGSHGLGYGLVNKKIRGSLINISNLKDENGQPAYGLWMISHSKEATKEIRGKDHSKTVPSMSDSQRRIVEGFADLILHIGPRYNEELDCYERVLTSKPSSVLVAKDRTGRLPETLVLPEPHDSPSGYEIIRDIIHGGEAPPEPPRKPRSKPSTEPDRPLEDDPPSSLDEPFPDDLSDGDMGDPPSDLFDDPPGEGPVYPDGSSDPPEDDGEVEVQEPPEEPEPPKKNGKKKTSGLPRWAQQAWEALSEMPEKGRVKYLRDQLAMVMDVDEDSVSWEEGWFKDNEKEINQVHERYVLRQAQKKNVALQELREKGEKKG